MGDNNLLKEMGIRINDRRHALKMTQEQLAEKMDVSIQMISNLELGKKAIRPENMVKLCEVLNISADYILTGKQSDVEVSEAFRKFTLLSEENRKIVENIISAFLK